MLNKYYSKKKPVKLLSQDLVPLDQWKQHSYMLAEIGTLAQSLHSLHADDADKARACLSRLHDRLTRIKHDIRRRYRTSLSVDGLEASETPTAMAVVAHRHGRLLVKRIKMKDALRCWLHDNVSVSRRDQIWQKYYMDGGYRVSNLSGCYVSSDELAELVCRLKFEARYVTVPGNIAKDDIIKVAVMEQNRKYIATKIGLLISTENNKVLETSKLPKLPSKIFHAIDWVILKSGVAVTVLSNGEVLAANIDDEDSNTFPLGPEAYLILTPQNIMASRVLHPHRYSISYFTKCLHWIEINSLDLSVVRKVPVPEPIVSASVDHDKQTAYLMTEEGTVYRVIKHTCTKIREQSNGSRIFTSIRHFNDIVFMASSYRVPTKGCLNYLTHFNTARKRDTSNQGVHYYSGILFPNVLSNRMSYRDFLDYLNDEYQYDIRAISHFKTSSKGREILKQAVKNRERYGIEHIVQIIEGNNIQSHIINNEMDQEPIQPEQVEEEEENNATQEKLKCLSQIYHPDIAYHGQALLNATTDMRLIQYKRTCLILCLHQTVTCALSVAMRDKVIVLQVYSTNLISWMQSALVTVRSTQAAMMYACYVMGGGGQLRSLSIRLE